MTWSYERDTYLRELDTEILEAGQDEGGQWVRLADTLFYPEAGGQPADQGWIGEVRVRDVRHVEGGIRHYTERPVDAAGSVHLRLDWERRFDHMQHHTGQHLLTAIAHDRFGWPTTAFHLGVELCDVELDTPEVGRSDLERLESEVTASIRAALPVRPRYVTDEEYRRLEVRTRGLPSDHRGDVRLVEIEGVDLNTCGGTHVRCTAEVEIVHLVGTERMRGGTRVYFVAGRRARERFRALEGRTAELRALLGVADAELVETVRAKLELAAGFARRERRLERDLAQAVADSLAAAPGRVISAHFEERQPAFLQQVGRRLTEMAPGRLALLTAGRGSEGFFLLAAGAELRLGLDALGREVASRLDGRGGGAGQLYQGKARSLDRRDEALAHLEQVLEA
jgi:Ser-tRNA(Ala) deacylase AlaX